MITAFTGTRAGLTPAQYNALIILAQERPPQAFRHGGCHGADFEFDGLLDKSQQTSGHTIRVHPGDRHQQQSFKNTEYREIYEPEPYLKRNRRMVDLSEELIAAPSTNFETLRSGTWATVRYARQCGLPVIVVNPDGSLS